MFRGIAISYLYKNQKDSRVIRLVCYAAIPGIAAQLFFFGWGVFLQLLLGITGAICSEVLVLKLRNINVRYIINNNSAILTGLLLAVSVPPLIPWWMVVVGSAFSIIVAKQFYGGLGNNLFNPAMVGYAVLLISFPKQMSNWILLPNAFTFMTSGLTEAFRIIFFDYTILYKKLNVFSVINNVTPIITPSSMDIVNIVLCFNYDINNIVRVPIHYSNDFSDMVWKYINIAWLLSGLILFVKRLIHWYIPISFITMLALCATLGSLVFPETLLPPCIHLFSGTTMLGAFFILTDPVTTAITKHGRLILGALAGFLVWLIRSFGNYLDAIVISVLLINLITPLINYYTYSKIYKRV